MFSIWQFVRKNYETYEVQVQWEPELTKYCVLKERTILSKQIRRDLEFKKLSSKWETTYKINRCHPGDWHIPGTAVVRMRKDTTFQQCYRHEDCYADGPQFAVSSSLKKNITNAHPVGPRDQYGRGVLSPTLHAVFAENRKTRNSKAAKS